MPVVLDLHGYAEGAPVHQLMSALGPFGDTHGFVTVTPQGSGASVPRWDTGLQSADVKFIGDLLDEVERTVCVDQHRVFVTGLSNGAFMTSAVACRKYADRIAAAAPVAGIRDIAGCKLVAARCRSSRSTAPPTRTSRTTAGSAAKAADLPAGDGSGKTLGQIGAVDPKQKGPTIPELTATWAKRNGCGTKPTSRQVAPDVTLIAFPCPKGAEAELYRVTGGGHTWPGSQFSKAIAGAVGPTTFSISANELDLEVLPATSPAELTSEVHRGGAQPADEDQRRALGATRDGPRLRARDARLDGRQHRAPHDRT